MSIYENAAAIRQRIAVAAAASGRDASAVTLVAVSKTVSADRLREAYDAGLTVFGENYVQEFLDKQAQLADLPIRWHFIGHLQRNKVASLVGKVDRIESVDSQRLADEIEKRCAAIGKTMEVLIEVNAAGEESKSGIARGDVLSLAEHIGTLPHLKLCGVMSIPEAGLSDEGMTVLAKELLSLCGELKAQGFPADTLSLGMSADFEPAIRAGSTNVRVGTALFGARYYPPKG